MDKPDFLRLLPELRDKYDVKKLIPLNEYTKWLKQLVRRAPDELGGKKGWIESAKRLYKTNTIDFKRIYSSLSTYERFDWETKLLTRQFKRPGYFDLIIKHAIVCGEVNDESWNHTYADIRPWELPTSEILLPEVSIVLSPMSRLSDVEKAFKDAKKLFNENIENLKYQTEVRKTEASELKRDRVWYWRNVAGESYLDIALTITSKDDREMYRKEKGQGRDYILELPKVRQAVRRYKKILKTL